jgi:hypothetical protein
VDKHFDDFRNDRALLTKLIEFVDKNMTNTPMMQKAGTISLLLFYTSHNSLIGENLKAQIANKLETGEVKKVSQFVERHCVIFLM